MTTSGSVVLTDQGTQEEGFGPESDKSDLEGRPQVEIEGFGGSHPV